MAPCIKEAVSKHGEFWTQQADAPCLTYVLVYVARPSYQLTSMYEMQAHVHCNMYVVDGLPADLFMLRCCQLVCGYSVCEYTYYMYVPQHVMFIISHACAPHAVPTMLFMTPAGFSNMTALVCDCSVNVLIPICCGSGTPRV